MITKDRYYKEVNYLILAPEPKRLTRMIVIENSADTITVGVVKYMTKHKINIMHKTYIPNLV